MNKSPVYAIVYSHKKTNKVGICPFVYSKEEASKKVLWLNKNFRQAAHFTFELLLPDKLINIKAKKLQRLRTYLSQCPNPFTMTSWYEKNIQA